MRKSSSFNNYQQFEREVLRGKSGPLSSAVEDIADEMFQLDVDREFDSMWDTADGESDL